uniref:Uncharacterized protein n=1 Tax=Alexandrium catenella TaxID=2925 RepID=A0A7S1KYL7_ALECA
MPVTPLARGMAACGWQPMADGCTASRVARAVSSSGSTTEQAACPALELIDDSSSDEKSLHHAARPSPPPPVERPAPARHSETAQVASVVGGEKYEKYESRDPASGRVWGVPSAFGGGQCLDCSNMAALPSDFCRGCQRRRAEACRPLQPEAMEELRCAVELLLQGTSAHARGSAAPRLAALYKKLLAARVEAAVEGGLREVAAAVSAGDDARVQRAFSELVKGHWRQHKGWLLDLKHLLSLR